MPDSSFNATSTNNPSLGTDVSVPPARGEAQSITVASRSNAATTGDGTLALSSDLADKVKTSKRATKQQLYDASVT